MNGRTMREVAETQANAWDAMKLALEHGQTEHAAQLAQVGIFAALIRIAGTPAARSGPEADPLDHDRAEPFQSATEMYWDEQTDRRLSHD